MNITHCYEVSAVGVENEMNSSELEFDGTYVVRYTGNHEPQMVKITNPTHKIIVGEVKWAVFISSDMLMI